MKNAFLLLMCFLLLGFSPTLRADEWNFQVYKSISMPDPIALAWVSQNDPDLPGKKVFFAVETIPQLTSRLIFFGEEQLCLITPKGAPPPKFITGLILFSDGSVQQLQWTTSLDYSGASVFIDPVVIEKMKEVGVLELHFPDMCGPYQKIKFPNTNEKPNLEKSLLVLEAKNLNDISSFAEPIIQTKGTTFGWWVIGGQEGWRLLEYDLTTGGHPKGITSLGGYPDHDFNAFAPGLILRDTTEAFKLFKFPKGQKSKNLKFLFPACINGSNPLCRNYKEGLYVMEDGVKTHGEVLQMAATSFPLDRAIYKLISPLYPAKNIEDGSQGQVLVKYDINDKGEIENISIVNAAPMGVFDKLAKSVLSNTKYGPGKTTIGVTRIIKYCTFTLVANPLCYAWDTRRDE